MPVSHVLAPFTDLLHPRTISINLWEFLYYVNPETGTPSRRCFRYIGFKTEARTFPKAVNMESSEHSPKKNLQANDCFRLLPLEVRFEIAYLLPTPEYLSLRLASKAMIPIFESQKFWKTRFLVHCERGFLNYLWKKVVKIGD